MSLSLINDRLCSACDRCDQCWTRSLSLSLSLLPGSPGSQTSAASEWQQQAVPDELLQTLLSVTVFKENDKSSYRESQIPWSFKKSIHILKSVIVMVDNLNIWISVWVCVYFPSCWLLVSCAQYWNDLAGAGHRQSGAGAGGAPHGAVL